MNFFILLKLKWFMQIVDDKCLMVFFDVVSLDSSFTAACLMSYSETDNILEWILITNMAPTDEKKRFCSII